MKVGYLYIVTCESFPGWVKVGITSNPGKRLQTYQTASPFRNYKMVYTLECPNFKEAEKKIKDTMHYFALDIKNEWYQVDLNIAITRLEEQLSEPIDKMLR